MVVLSTACLLSFAVPISVQPSQRPSTLLRAVVVLMIGVLLDLLRWHHRRVIRLLMPEEAVSRVVSTVKAIIDRTQERAAALAQVQRESVTGKGEGGTQSRGRLDTTLHVKFDKHREQVLMWTCQLAEIPRKAVIKSEVHAARLVLAGLSDVVCHYLRRTEGNLTLMPRDLLVFGTDADEVLVPIYEHFKDINRAAVSAKPEAISIAVVKGFGQIATWAVRLDSTTLSVYGARSVNWLWVI